MGRERRKHGTKTAEPVLRHVHFPARLSAPKESRPVPPEPEKQDMVATDSPNTAPAVPVSAGVGIQNRPIAISRDSHLRFPHALPIWNPQLPIYGGSAFCAMGRMRRRWMRCVDTSTNSMIPTGRGVTRWAACVDPKNG